MRWSLIQTLGIANSVISRPVEIPKDDPRKQGKRLQPGKTIAAR